MLSAEVAHPEGPRYAASLVCIPGLWTGPALWGGVGSYLAHRGWECHLVDAGAVRGGVDARAEAVAEYVAELDRAAILVAHDGGALVALAAAARRPPSALVFVAPLPPRTRAARALTATPRRLAALVLGGPITPPEGRGAVRWLPAGHAARARVESALHAEDAAVVRDVLWGAPEVHAVAGVPALVVAGAADPLVSVDASAGFAAASGAELRVLDGVGHWPLVEGWQDAVSVVHRWLVRRLGEPLLETYAEAMADRDAEDPEEP
jgi:pimeloyl-ACP methyl ester carboxylesterase